MSSPFIFDWVLEHAERRPDAPAVDGLDARLTYASLAERVLDLAGDLAAKGITAGERVLIVLPAGPASVVASLAVQSLGACAVDVNRAIGAEGLQAIVRQVDPRHAILAPPDGSVWKEALRGRVLEGVWFVGGGGPLAGDGFQAREATLLRRDGRLDRDRGQRARPARLDDGAAALVLLTSGSTGKVRGVIHTFRNIHANTRSIVEYLGLADDDRAMAILPFSYTYGRSVLQTHLYAGGSIFVDPRFMYPWTVMEAVGLEGCTGFAGVPMTFEILRRSVDLSRIPMPRLRYVTQAGGPMRAETTHWARGAFAPARLFVMYGQTEATARLSYLPPERGEEKTGSIGIPIPGVDLRVVDDDGAELPPGEMGHLVARGDNVTPGYLGAPEETAAVLRGGWLWTGDLARRDEDDYLWLMGRKDELLKVGGFRVSATEIEALLLDHPAVVDAAVVGVDDPLQGTVAVAFVVLSRPAPPLAELRRACRDRGGVHRMPAEIVVVDAVPRGPSGKTLKAQLAMQARAARQTTTTP